MKKRKLIRFTAVLLVLAVIVSAMPGLIPRAHAFVGLDPITLEQSLQQVFMQADEAAIRGLMQAAQSYSQIGSLENLIQSGLLGGAALANAEAILVQLKAGAAVTGVSAASCSTVLTVLGVAGVTIAAVDWDSYWNMFFDKPAYEQNYKNVDNPLSGFIVNNTHIDEWATALINAAGADAWDWDYVEMTNKGWKMINDWAKGIFGDGSGSKSLPEIDELQVLDIMNCNLAYEDSNCITYIAPTGTMYVKSTDPNEYIYSYLRSDGRSAVYYRRLDKSGNEVITDWPHFTAVPTAQYELNVHIRKGGTTVYIGARYTGFSLAAIPDYYISEQTTVFKLPEIPYNSKIGDMSSIPSTDGTSVITLPKTETSPSASDEQRFWDYIRNLQDFNPGSGTSNPDPDDPKPTPELPTEDKPLTEGEIKWGKLMEIAVFDKFPFSIPKDVYMFVDALAVPQKEPKFEFTVVPESAQARYGVTAETVVLDFSQFESIRQIVRTCFLVLFIIGLAAATKNFIWTGGG